jgi:2,4-dienoyl-CoA reductase-like NADH-dependent reductase (Old Yellow Enzyme family)
VSLFEPITINGVRIPNRIVKSAMAEGRCDAEGRPTPALARLYEKWSRGGVGLAITGMAHIRKHQGYTGKEIGLYDDALVEPLRALTAAVHRHPGKIFAQICHAPPQVSPATAKRYGCGAPSTGFNRVNLRWDWALPGSELEALVRDFGAAARRAREAGFDGVQLHGAHGYLLSRMISPRHNRRTDRWGGDFDRRLTFLREVYRAIRAEVGSDYPVIIKLNAHDAARRGLDLETAVRIGQRLQEWGMDANEVSAGTGDVGLGFYPNRGEIPVGLGKRFLAQQFAILRPVVPALGPIIRVLSRSVAFPGEAYFEPLARRFAEALRIPVLCVGGIRSRAVAERILRETPIAMVSMARPLVREPHLPRAWQKDPDAVAACTSCNKCFAQIGLGRPLACYTNVGSPDPSPVW